MTIDLDLAGLTHFAADQLWQVFDKACPRESLLLRAIASVSLVFAHWAPCHAHSFQEGLR